MRARTSVLTQPQSTPRDAPGPADGLAPLSGDEIEPWLVRQPEFALVLFHAPWSAACRLELEVLDHLASYFQGRVRVGAVDAAASEDAAHRYGVSWVPTLILFEAGREVARWEGARALADLTIEIQAALTRA